MTPTTALLACLALAPAPLDDDLDAALRQLREPWPDARARAVRKLARLGSKEAWERVREALEDREPQVADAAQRAMAGVEDPRVLAGWLGREGLRDRDRWVRLRVAQVAGTVELSVDGRALVRALDRRDVELSRAVCASVEAQARAGRLTGDPEDLADPLERVQERPDDAHLRADALAALVALDRAAAAPRLEEASVADEALLRAAAVRLASVPGALARIGRAAADADPRVRVAALERLATTPRRAALEVLVRRLEEEPRRHLRRRALAALRGLSGMRYREDPRPWRRWLAGLPADWRPGEAVEEDEEARPRTRAGTGVFPLPSDRLCVLIDLSGSLWAERENGRSRKELLDRELRSLLERMPPTAAFNLIPYATRPEPWRESLVEASRRNVRAALREFEGTHMTGKGNLWDALRIALADRTVDTVLIVTDGAPTGGHRWDLTLMAELIERERRWSGVAVSTVLVDASERLQRRWRDVAERTGGLSVAVDFDALGAGDG